MEELGRKSVEDFKLADKKPLVVVMDNIRSMHNVGSIFRTADGFLASGIFLCGYTPQPPHRDIHKTALGATESVTWKYFPKTNDAIAELKAEGYKIYGIEQAEGSILLQDFKRGEAEKIALIFGNEAEGVEQETLHECEGCIEIPQFGSKHSLNISVAAGVVLWEMARKGILNQ